MILKKPTTTFSFSLNSKTYLYIMLSLCALTYWDDAIKHLTLVNNIEPFNTVSHYHPSQISDSKAGAYKRKPLGGLQ
jgi:hypothetical protein